MKKKMSRVMPVWAVLMLVLIVPSLPVYPLTEVLFSPDDKPTERLISLIQNAQEKIYAAIYMLTDKKIAQALIAAKQERTIDVQIVLDQASFDNEFGKAKLLQSGGVPIFFFAPPGQQTSSKYKTQPLMHNKFALIDNKVWTGSFNWTNSANKRNEENVIITDDTQPYERYSQRFAVLKQRCSEQPRSPIPGTGWLPTYSTINATLGKLKRLIPTR